MRIFKSAATVSFYTMLSRILGFLRDVLIASIMGAGPIADAFQIAFRFPNLFRRLFAEGAFNAAFIPTFSSTLNQEGAEHAKRAASDILSVLFLFLLGFVLLIELTAPWVIDFIAPGFKETPERSFYATQFVRVTFPSILFISMAALYTGVLNSIYRFAVGAASPIILNIAMIIALLFFENSLGNAGHSLSWAVVIASCAQCFWVYKSCQKNDFHITLKRPLFTTPVKKVLKLMVPGALSAGVIQFNIFIGIAFLSYLSEGAPSRFFYADRLNQLPLGLVGVALSTALLPALSQHISKGNHDLAHSVQNRAMELSLSLILPASVALLVLSEPMIQVLFERYNFTHADTLQTAKILSCFALGLPAYVLVKVFSTSFFARQDTRTPLVAAILAVVTNIFLNFLLLNPFQEVGIAMATSIASWVNVGWLAFRLRKHRHFKADQQLFTSIPRILTATLLMGIVVELLAKAMTSYLSSSQLTRFISLIFIIGAGIAVYGALCFIFNLFSIFKRKAQQA